MKIILLFALLLTLSLHVSEAKKVAAIFVFGDSSLDGGTNTFIPNCTITAKNFPYGLTYFNEPTGRFTNGRTMADFIAQALDLPLPLPYLKPGADFKYGANFASAGSGLMESTNQKEGVISLSKQIEQFEELVKGYRAEKGEVATTEFLMNSVFLIASGVNDLSENYLMHPTMPPPQFTQKMIATQQEAIETLYRYGARGIVTFAVPPAGCSPRARSVQISITGGRNRGCFAPANALVQLYNSAIENMLDGLARELPDAQLVLLKSYNWVMKVLNRPQVYGFSDASSACCGAGVLNAGSFCYELSKPRVCPDPTRYFFWDAAHLTEKAYFEAFQQFWYEKDLNLSAPYNLQTLFQYFEVHPEDVH